MTDIVTPPTISAMPAAPTPTDTPQDFSTKAFAQAAALAGLVSQTNASAAATNQNAIAAQERATTAGTAATTAGTHAANAATSATNAATSATTAGTHASNAATSAADAEASRIAASKLNLGNKTTPPTVDNQGAALLAGATYYDTTLNKWRVWTGSAWGDGISSISGVSSFNGQTGAVTGVSSVNGQTGAVTGVATLTGTETLQNKTYQGVRETMVTANTGTAYTINIASGTIFDLTLTGNCVYTFPTATSGNQFTILQRQDATGSRTVAWPASVRWAGGTAPTITATASRTDVISFVADGTYWLGFVGGLNYTRA